MIVGWIPVHKLSALQVSWSFRAGWFITLVEEMFRSNEETSSEDDDGGRTVSRLNILGSRKIDQLSP